MLDEVIHENFREEAQEIKRRLSSKGQDVDETVICELLASLPTAITNRTEYVIRMITGVWNFQEHSDKAKPFLYNEPRSQVQNDIEEVPKSDIHNSTTEDSVETINVSDSEDDRDYYYDFSNYDNISILDIRNTATSADTTASSSSSGSIFDTTLDEVKTISNNKPITKTHNVDRGAAETESLKENNNNDVIYMKSVICERNRFSESPTPGCSKDSDDRSRSLKEYCSSCNFDELQIDANRIYSLLPNFDYPLIYKTLLNNKLAKNRIELTLWDLLPKERPSPQLANKRKRIMPLKMRPLKCKKNSSVLPEKKVTCTRIVLEKEEEEEKKEQACARNEIKVIDVELKNRESISLANETDEIKMDITEDATAMNNTDDNTNNLQIDMALEAKLNQLDTSTNDVNMCKDVRDSKKSLESSSESPQSSDSSKSSENDSKNKELQSTMNLAMPHKTKMNNIYCTTISTAMPSIAASSTADPSTACTSTAGPSTAGPSIADSSTAGTSTADPSTAGPSTAGLSTAVLRIPTIDMPRTIMSVLRPARFTGFKAGAPSVVSSSKQSSPILSPPKLQLVSVPDLEYTQNIPNRVAMKAVNDSRSEMNKQIVDSRVWKKLPRALSSHSSVKRMNKTIVPPNKMQSSVKTEGVKTEEVKFPEKRSASVSRPLPSFDDSLKFAQNRTFFHPLLIQKITENKILDNLELALDFAKFTEEKSSGEEKNNLTQQDDMNALQVQKSYDIEEQKQNFVSSYNVGMNGNKKEQRGTANNVGRQEIILSEGASKIYYKLIPMFPTVDTVYIKQQCQSYLTENMLQTYDEAALLQSLIDYLLDHGQNYPTVRKAELSPEANNSNTYDLNDHYADLLGIFPEADPIYLRKIAEENYTDPEKIKEFVQSKLENPDYPTRAQYLAKKKITEQQKQYTTDFKIQQFLELFPEPFSHFENATRQCKFNPHAVDFLKYYFSKIRVNTLLNTYSENLHNLSLTAKALEVLSPDMKSKRSHNKILTEDIPLLQECAFIQHKVELKKYLTELKNQEEKEFEELKAKNELIECQCCFDNECMPSKCSTCEDGHLFCNACIVRGTELILGDGKAHVDCLLKCGSEFPLSVLQQVLPPTKFSILLCKRQEAEVMAAGLEGLVSCPFCHFASIPPPEDRVFRCLNPNCMKESCRLCKELNHVPLKCHEKKSDAARLYLEEKMTEALIRKCYKCGRTFFKEEGCNKMTCVCGAQMCYICDQPVTDYRHFQGQGVLNSNLCPLWSDDRRLNAESVIKVCRETMKQIKQKDPQVDINVNALLPKLPPKRKGPHEDVAQAHEMPAHAERIARHNP